MIRKGRAHGAACRRWARRRVRRQRPQDDREQPVDRTGRRAECRAATGDALRDSAGICPPFAHYRNLPRLADWRSRPDT